MNKLNELYAKLQNAKGAEKNKIQNEIDSIVNARRKSIANYTDKFVKTSLFYGSKEEQELNIAIQFDESQNVLTETVNAANNTTTERVVSINIDTDKKVILPSFGELRQFSGEYAKFWDNCNDGLPFNIKFHTVKTGDTHPLTKQVYTRPTFAITELIALS